MSAIKQNLGSDFYTKLMSRAIKFGTSKTGQRIEVKRPCLVMSMGENSLSVITEGYIHVNKEGEVILFVKMNRDIDRSFSNALFIELTELEAAAYASIEDARYAAELLLNLMDDPTTTFKKIEKAFNLITSTS